VDFENLKVITEEILALIKTEYFVYGIIVGFIIGYLVGRVLERIK
jgi:F0F1-type ATP synthase assembly protein I